MSVQLNILNPLSLIGDVIDVVRSGRVGLRLPLALFLILLALIAGLPSAQAQGSDRRCRRFNSSASFWMSNSGFASGTVSIYLNDECSPPSDGTMSAGEHGMVDAYDRQDAIRNCNKYNGYSDNTVSPFGSFWRCNPETDTDSGSSSGTSRSNAKGKSSSKTVKSRRRVVPAGPPTGELIQAFGIRVTATLGLHSGIQFQRRDAAAIGIQSVIDMGVLDVVDVWGNVGGTYEVCFPQSGSIVFLDAATSPRTVSSIDSEVKDGFTCASMDRAGMMVLAQPAASEATAPAATARGTATAPSSALANQLTQCEVTTLYNLNLRSTPSGETILTVIAYQTTMTATQRTDQWFFVSIDDKQGWISSRYVSTWGYCRTQNLA